MANYELIYHSHDSPAHDPRRHGVEPIRILLACAKVPFAETLMRPLEAEVKAIEIERTSVTAVASLSEEVDDDGLRRLERELAQRLDLQCSDVQAALSGLSAEQKEKLKAVLATEACAWVSTGAGPEESPNFHAFADVSLLAPSWNSVGVWSG